jgi:hypothetical protein
MDKVIDKAFGLHQKFNINTHTNCKAIYLVFNQITNFGCHIKV